MQQNINKDFDLVIVGSGPAGLTAGIYAVRGMLKTAILEKNVPGGKIAKTSEVENYTGIENITGPDLAMAMYKHAEKLGVSYLYGDVSSIEKENNLFKVTTEDGQIYITKAVIIATGTKERLIGIPGEVEFYGKGISYCAVCDAALYKGSQMVVVGGGNSALEEALYLSKFTDKITLIHRRQEFRADKTVVEMVKKNKSITLCLDSTITGIYGDSVVRQVKIKELLTNKEYDFKTDIVFPFIGQDPVTSFIKLPEVLTPEKYIKTNDLMETTIPGLFAAGDVIDKHLRQISTAVGDGSIAAQSAIHYVTNLDNA